MQSWGIETNSLSNKKKMRWSVLFDVFRLLLNLALVATMDRDSSSTKSMKVPVFTGKQEDFQVWWMRFKSFATLMGFAAAIGKTKENDLPDEEEEKQADTDTQKIARKRNLTGVYYFTLAFTTEALMGLVLKSCNTEWPSGLAYLIVQALFAKYRPKDTISRVELRMKLNKLSLGRNKDPATLFETVSSI